MLVECILILLIRFFCGTMFDPITADVQAILLVNKLLTVSSHSILFFFQNKPTYPPDNALQFPKILYSPLSQAAR